MHLHKQPRFLSSCCARLNLEDVLEHEDRMSRAPCGAEKAIEGPEDLEELVGAACGGLPTEVDVLGCSGCWKTLSSITLQNFPPKVSSFSASLSGYDPGTKLLFGMATTPQKHWSQLAEKPWPMPERQPEPLTQLQPCSSA
mmetsp:Transcript_48308/g.115095  ORF Transcript_48308/g.115095 Transcript_48308/m.115095 type:complete len:141 (-) Transcript_48308:24-446(-)